MQLQEVEHLELKSLHLVEPPAIRSLLSNLQD